MNESIQENNKFFLKVVNDGMKFQRNRLDIERILDELNFPENIEEWKAQNKEYIKKYKIGVYE